MEKDWKDKLRELVGNGYHLVWEEVKNELTQKLDIKITEYLESYTKSRAISEPYEKRKNLAEKISLAEELLSEYRNPPKNVAEWMEPDDFTEIEKQGLKRFLEIHFSRSVISK